MGEPNTALEQLREYLSREPLLHIAKRSGIPHPTLHRIKKHGGYPSFRTLQRIIADMNLTELDLEKRKRESGTGGP